MMPPRKLRHLLASHAKDILRNLKEQNCGFSIACDRSLIDFDPPLNPELEERMGRVSVFVLMGYSLQSLELFEESLSFEAGLSLEDGKDIGTLLSLPYECIIEILLQEQDQAIPIFINPFEISEVQVGLQDSMQAILSRNADLLS